MVKVEVSLIDKEGESDLLIEAKNFFSFTKIKGDSRKNLNLISLDFLELTEYSVRLSDYLLLNPKKAICLLERAINELGYINNPCILIENLTSRLDINKVRARHIGQLFAIRGVIKRLTKVLPRTVDINYSCPTCGTVIQIPQLGKKRLEPTKCSCGRKGGFKVEAENIRNIQELNLEEVQDELDGKQPQQVRVYLEEWLTDASLCSRLQPGKRVEIIGIIDKLPLFMTQNDTESNLSEFMLYANNIILETSEEDLSITEEDELRIKEISLENPLDKLAYSLIPEVYGNDIVKKAICLQCVKGVSKDRSDGSSSREDINILLCGDVGVAKSVTLKAAVARTPKSKMVVGTKTSKVGLGAMAVKDELTNTWSLEVGALALANGSMLAIDELDKMYKEHLSELLEPMSASTITINKAGISATLPAKTSILASANPIHGNYELDQPLAKQIDLPSPILNRFDLIFVLIDKPNKEYDSMAVEHIFHSYKEKMVPEIPLELFKKYITYCKRLKPTLHPSLMEHIRDFYVDLRNRSKGVKSIPVNLRNMEAVVKLAEAHAKIRLSNLVEVEDLEEAKKIFLFCVEQLLMDKDMNVIDISRTSSRVPQAKRPMMEWLLELLHTMEEESSSREFLFKDVVKRAVSKGLEYWKVKNILEYLKMENEIIEPRPGVIKLT